MKQAERVIHLQTVNLLVMATTKVLQTLAGIEAELENICWQQDLPIINENVSAAIGITRENTECLITLSFPFSMASLIISRWTGLSGELVSRSMCSDGIGELANVISGNTKTILSDGDQIPYKLSLPSMDFDSDSGVKANSQNDNALLTFKVTGEIFNLHISFGS